MSCNSALVPSKREARAGGLDGKWPERRDIIAFGPFRLYATERRLERDGVALKLGSRALDILIALVERATEVVSKRDLLARVWPNLVVDEGSLRFHVAALRKALGAGQPGVRYVTNVPGRGYCFVAPISRLAPLPPAADQAARWPIRLLRMVGRDEDVETITGQLVRQRFVSIVGPGGIGKTTVAVSVAHALTAEFGGAVHFVDLAPLANSLLVPSALASTLGVSVNSDSPISSLVACLRDRRMLLVIDNCEHVIETAAAVAETIFREAQQVHILATSRESLRVEGEQVYRLLPLGCPPDAPELTAAEALTFPAVRLFVDRVAASAHLFRLSDPDAPIACEICRKLDGIALALELAAGRVGVHGIRGTAALLDNPLRLLCCGRRTAPPRHQTLSAALDWSYQLLPGLERLVLRRLSVFAGTFSLEAARAVAAEQAIDDWEVIEAVENLVTKSLVVADRCGSETSYRLLQTTRAYALGKLIESGEAAAIASGATRNSINV